jgi:hypothetical protein
MMGTSGTIAIVCVSDIDATTRNKDRGLITPIEDGNISSLLL